MSGVETIKKIVNTTLIMDSKDIKRNIPMVKLPWYGNLPNAFIQETVFATILKCSNPEKSLG
jgi:hypothetical protein